MGGGGGPYRVINIRANNISEFDSACTIAIVHVFNFAARCGYVIEIFGIGDADA